jgi:hypothetical protein
VGIFDGGYRIGESGKFLRFDLIKAHAKAACNAEMPGNVELDAGALGPVTTVFDVMGEALLPGVEINGRNALTGLKQGDRNVHGGRRFSRTAFFVSEDDDMGRARLADVRLH